MSLFMVVHTLKIDADQFSEAMQSDDIGEFAKAIAVTLADKKLHLYKTVLGARHSNPACLDEIWDGKEESKIDAFLGGSASHERTMHFAALRKAIAEVQI